jgi:hypothetical protein
MVRQSRPCMYIIAVEGEKMCLPIMITAKISSEDLSVRKYSVIIVPAV